MIIRNPVDLPFNKYFSFNASNTRGHSMKLNFNHSRLDCGKYFFSNRCIDVRNNKLTENEVSFTSLKSFKKAIDKIDFTSYCRGRAFDV